MAWQCKKDKLPAAAGLYPLAEAKGLPAKVTTETDEGEAKQVAARTGTLTGI